MPPGCWRHGSASRERQFPLGENRRGVPRCEHSWEGRLTAGAARSGSATGGGWGFAVTGWQSRAGQASSPKNNAVGLEMSCPGGAYNWAPEIPSRGTLAGAMPRKCELVHNRAKSSGPKSSRIRVLAGLARCRRWPHLWTGRDLCVAGRGGIRRRNDKRPRCMCSLCAAQSAWVYMSQSLRGAFLLPALQMTRSRDPR
jgi:hypothetical protein